APRQAKHRQHAAARAVRPLPTLPHHVPSSPFGWTTMPPRSWSITRKFSCRLSLNKRMRTTRKIV
ncbi:hypothetical protein GUJ93_ZPchr0002g23810, partial [Zizania palustris]